MNWLEGDVYTVKDIIVRAILVAATSFSASRFTTIAKAGQPMDGFFAYCTSNLDGTGSCVNEEDGKAFTCIVVPGQIISCPAKKNRVAIECVWISNIYANQAQFWCDKEAEEAMYSQAEQLEENNIQQTPRKSNETVAPKEKPFKTFDNAF